MEKINGDTHDCKCLGTGKKVDKLVMGSPGRGIKCRSFSRERKQGLRRYIYTNVCGKQKSFPMDSFAPDYACYVLDLHRVSIPFVEFRILIRSGALVLHRVVCSGELGVSLRIAAGL